MHDLQKAREENLVMQFLLNYPQINNGQPQELTSKSRSFWKGRPCQVTKGGGSDYTTFLHLLPTLTSPLPPEPSTFLHPCSLALFIRSIWRRKQYRKTKFKESLGKNWTSLLTHFKHFLPFLFLIFSFHLPSVNWSAICKD